MTIFWVIVLVIFGFAQGWSTIDPLFWWLLVPFAIVDLAFSVKSK
jgi:hypothetical protein